MLSDVMHPSDEHLEEYSFQRMEASARDRLEEHLLWCEHCQGRLREAEAFRSHIRPLLREVERKQTPTVSAGWWTSLWGRIPSPVLIAGMALILVIGTQISRFSEPSRRYESASLTTTRGSGNVGPVEIHTARTMDFNLDATGLDLPVIFRVQVVGTDGEPVASLVASGPKFTLDKALRPGTYFIRLNTATGEALREYVIKVVP